MHKQFDSTQTNTQYHLFTKRLYNPAPAAPNTQQPSGSTPAAATSAPATQQPRIVTQYSNITQ